MERSDWVFAVLLGLVCLGFWVLVFLGVLSLIG